MTEPKATDDVVPLPSLDDMRDTLRFMWVWFMDQLDGARRADPNADLNASFNEAAIVMRIRDYVDATSATQRFLELNVAGPGAAFDLIGRFSTEPGLFPTPDGIDWRLTGDHAACCEWMLPWVALHIERGGGYIEFDYS